ncbi:glycosyltransferase family 39 protein [Chitiniphilus purpureus]|uniref:Glycosyltransferase family 39 protein n=1 Tax=Chitiniphilus purpureus TaxID=2981137 RepID=A0ABY6DKS8_9NEIS|nr:glycosyltransferase family 39 protein [Chitiniphilus sp. CD1]UXY14965.1 glycosyltransferase family 39 protein [Chitiniphilus sp. CD1]
MISWPIATPAAPPSQPHAKAPGWLRIGYCLIIALALLLRLMHVLIADVDSPVRGDAIQHVSYAWNLLHHGVFSSVPPDTGPVIADSFRDPGYPLFLAAVMALTPDWDAWYQTVLLLQVLLGVATVAGVLVLGRRLLPPGMALLAGLLAAVWPHHVVISGYLLTETLFGTLLVLALLLFSQAAARQRLRWWIAAGLGFGCAAMVNAVLLPFALLLGLVLLWQRRADRRQVLALIAVAALLPALWGARNATLATGLGSTDRALMNFVQGSWPDYHSSWREGLAGVAAGQRTQARINEEIDLLRRDRAQGLATMGARLAADPGRHIGWYLIHKPFLFWDWDIRMGYYDIFVYPTANAPFQNKAPWMALAAVFRAINPFLTGLTLIALACGALALLRRLRTGAPTLADPRDTTIAALLLLLLFGFLVYWTLQAEPRYAIPFRPLQCLLLAVAMQWAWWAWASRTVRGRIETKPAQP